MIPPGEITMVNTEGKAFRARVTQRDDGAGGSQYLYNKVRQAFQYRVILPGVEQSLVVIDVTENELRHYMVTGTPVRIKPLL